MRNIILDQKNQNLGPSGVTLDFQLGVTFGGFLGFFKNRVEKTASVPPKIGNFQKFSFLPLKNYIRRFEWAINEGIWFWESKVMALSKSAFLG